MKSLIYFISFLCFSTVSAQTIFFEESFDDCTLPAGWESETPNGAKGWLVGNSEFLSSDILVFPDLNGNCFIANNDSKWDDESGDQNHAAGDKITLPFMDFSSVEHLVFSLDYVSGYGGGLNLYYRTENTEWESIYNAVIEGGILQWQHEHIHVAGSFSTPIKDLSEPIQFMFEFSDFGLSKFLGTAIDNIKIYEPEEHDLILANVHISEVAPIGLTPIKPAMLNRGRENISDIVVKWQVDEGTIESKVVSKFLVSSGSASLYMFPFGQGLLPEPTIFANFQDEGKHTLRVWLEHTGNLVDPTPDNNYWEGEVIVSNELPEKQYVYEKFSHHTCAPCYEADLLAQEIAEANDKIHIVSVHSSSTDPMDYPIVDEIDIAYSQRTHPGTIMDRRFLDLYEHGRMSSLYENLPVVTTPWWSPIDVVFTSKEVDLDNGQIHLDIEAEFMVAIPGEFRFNIWTMENNIVAYQAGAPQGNNYVHNHVLRHYTGGNYGAEGSLPAQVVAGEKYTYSVTIDIDPSWNVDELEFMAIVQKYKKDSDDRDIMNVSKISVDDQIIVSSTQEDLPKFNIYPNPASQYITIVLEEQTATAFSISIYNVLGELMKHESIAHLEQNYVQYDVSNLANGNYMLILESASKKQVKQFSIAK